MGNNCFHPTKKGWPLTLSSYQTPHVRWVAPCLLVNGYLFLGVLRKDGVSFQLNHLERKHQNPPKILSLPLLASIFQKNVQMCDCKSNDLFAAYKSPNNIVSVVLYVCPRQPYSKPRNLHDLSHLSEFLF